MSLAPPGKSSQPVSFFINTFIGLIGVSSGWFFIFFACDLWFTFFCGFLFGYAQARCEPNLRLVENAGWPYESL